ncbi:unnamed protein product [Caenorhabditis auriculariae]|uniref:Uncharacterized protein n=1 Tax=Caenorhabditis auriculariae TaxID=2777116 RepID=A0A8S1HNR9_9PELO|nr:unnamed protein product [Caenorhabditis auriculariae]
MAGPEEPICQVMLKLIENDDGLGMVKHKTMCLSCVLEAQSKFPPGEEFLWPNDPPPWIDVSEEEKDNPQNLNKHMRKFEKRKLLLTPEDIDEYLEGLEYGDEKLVYEISKYKKVDKMEARKIMRDIRRKQKEKQREKEEDEKNAKKQKEADERASEKLRKADEKRIEMGDRRSRIVDGEQLQAILAMDKEELRLQEAVEKAVEEAEKNEKKKKGDTHKKPTGPAVFNKKSAMPWMPSPVDIIGFEDRSKFSYEDQKRYVAICQNLTNTGDYRHTTNREEMKDFLKASQEERDGFTELALQWADDRTHWHPLDSLTRGAIDYIQSNWKKRIPNGKHYLVGAPVFTMNSEDLDVVARGEKTVLEPKMVRLLQKGKSDFLTFPDMTKQCSLESVVGLERPEKVAIQDDEIVRELCYLNDLDVAMDATTACHLMCESWESHEFDIAVPISILNDEVQGKTRKLVIFEKPSPTNTISRATVQRQFMKHSLRNTFVKSSPAPLIKEKPKEKKAIEQDDSEEKQPVHPSLLVRPSSSLEIVTFETSETSETPERPIESSESPEESVSQFQSKSGNPDSTPTAGVDLLDSILSDISKAATFAPSPTKISWNDPNRPSSTGYQYGIFKIGEIDVLIRSAPSPKVQPLHAYAPDYLKVRQQLVRKLVSFEPRIEYMPNCGAMALGTEEWLWNHLKKTFKGSAAHALFRTHFSFDQVLQLDLFSMSGDLRTRPEDAFSVLSSRTLRFEKLLKNSMNLANGNYAIYKENGQPLRIIRAVDSSTRNAIDGSMFTAIVERPMEIESEKPLTIRKAFYGWCMEVLLQWQIVQSRAPGTFLPADSPIIRNLPSKNTLMEVSRNRNIFKKQINRAVSRTREQLEMERARAEEDVNQIIAELGIPTDPDLAVVCGEHRASRGRGGHQWRGRGAGFRGRGRGRPPWGRSFRNRGRGDSHHGFRGRGRLGGESQEGFQGRDRGQETQNYTDKDAPST